MYRYFHLAIVLKTSIDNIFMESSCKGVRILSARGRALPKFEGCNDGALCVFRMTLIFRIGSCVNFVITYFALR